MVRTTDQKEKYLPIEKVNDNVYIIRWDYEDLYDTVYEETGEVDENGMPIRIDTGEKVETNLASWTYKYLYFTPSVEYIKNFILDYFNKKIDQKILSGFVWNDMPVWLSSENQFNYKAAYDLAIQTQGATLPVTFKFGTASEPVYYTFTDIVEFSEFYTQAIAYVNTVLAEGWAKKDAIDWSAYEIKD